MTEHEQPAQPSPDLTGEAETLAQLEALRRDTSHWHDPTRWRYLDALAQRLHAAQGAVRPILLRKLTQGLADYAASSEAARRAMVDQVAQWSAQQPGQARELQRRWAAGDMQALLRLRQASRPAVACAPLAELNRYLQAATGGEGAVSVHTPLDAPPEMKSLQRFRDTWSRLSTEDQLAKAIGRAPDNAGPLNTHMLMLRALSMMQALSPDYVWRFLSQAETLLWLEQAAQRPTAAEPKAARRGRVKK